MLRLLGPGVRLCDGWNRREVVRIGGLGFYGAGFPLSDLLGATATANGSMSSTSSFGRARSCILLFLMGGPPQHSTWATAKPDAPAEVRGDLVRSPRPPPACRSLSCSLVPPWSLTSSVSCGLFQRVTTGRIPPAGDDTLTGQPHQPMNFENANPGPPNDAPSLGAVLRRISKARGGLPPSVTLPHRIFNTENGVHLAGPGCRVSRPNVRPLAPECSIDPRGIQDPRDRPARRP